MVPQLTDDVVTTMPYKVPHFKFWMVHLVPTVLQIRVVLSLLMAIALYMPALPLLAFHCTPKELVLQFRFAWTWSGRHGAVGGTQIVDASMELFVKRKCETESFTWSKCYVGRSNAVACCCRSNHDCWIQESTLHLHCAGGCVRRAID